jgi:ABC-type multidrug transport system fused ATPase/permease subunit
MLEILDTPLPGAHATAAAVAERTPARDGAAMGASAPPSAVLAPGAPPPEIRFAGVHVAYEDGARPALRGLDLLVPAGRTVALVGESGAGKSTAAGLLLRFVDADAGAVTVDGEPLDGIDPAAWRRSIAWVPQAPHLFAATVADNIRLARPDATDAQVEAAARDADADGFIRALPQGYGTLLGEDGARLSGGQQ